MLTLICTRLESYQYLYMGFQQINTTQTAISSGSTRMRSIEQLMIQKEIIRELLVPRNIQIYLNNEVIPIVSTEAIHIPFHQQGRTLEPVLISQMEMHLRCDPTTSQSSLSSRGLIVSSSSTCLSFAASQEKRNRDRRCSHPSNTAHRLKFMARHFIIIVYAALPPSAHIHGLSPPKIHDQAFDTHLQTA